MQMLQLIELLCVFQIMKLRILTNLELNMFLKKLKDLLDIKTNIFIVKANNSIMC